MSIDKIFTNKKFEPDFLCILILTEAIIWRYPVKKVLLKISQIHSITVVTESLF